TRTPRSRSRSRRSSVPSHARPRARTGKGALPASAAVRNRPYSRPDSHDRGKESPLSENVARRSGWITFAGVMAVIAGGYNALSGIAALSDDDTLAAQARDVLYGIDLTAWGWFWLIIGVVQLLTGALILQRNMWGLWLGIVFASISALMTVLVMFVFP